ncbi:DUF3261 domain-containing protein [Pseudomaricurvus sp.]|uniref:DUF3261 domain-containing protein n=1 Tax=Pseudomaricurvus sp. TaxID=2004510 RepID=UPI003F6D4BCB
MIRPAISAMLIVLLAACSSWPSRHQLPELPLLSPASLGQQWQLTQSVSIAPLSAATDNRQPQTLLAAWSVTEERLDLAGLTLMGQTLLTLSYDGDNFSESTSPLLPDEVSGRDILTQIQLAYWPVDVIQKALAGSDWTLEATGDRILYLGQKPALTIAIADGNKTDTPLESITITNHLMHYQLQIQTLTREKLNRAESP